MKLIKSNIKFIIVIVVCLVGSSITTLATNYLFNSNEVSYDNTESGLHADYVQGAIDEVFQHATDYSEIKTKIGTGSLTTTSNTLIGGINELNNSFTGIEITKNTDLNSLTTPGNYYSPNSTRSATLTNTPLTNSGFSLVVKKRENYVDQEIQYNSNIYTRGSSSSGFSNWEQYAKESNLASNYQEKLNLSTITFTPETDVTVIDINIKKYGRIIFGTIWIRVPADKTPSSTILGRFSEGSGTQRLTGFGHDLSPAMFLLSGKTLRVDNNWGINAGDYRITVINYVN